MPEIASLTLGDPPQLWAELGFVVEDGATWLGGTRYLLTGVGNGIREWSLRGADDLRELPVTGGDPPPAQPTPEHPNGVTGLDHIVIATPDLPRTIDIFEANGLELRRTRDTGTPERPSTQAFFWLGETIAEVVGSRGEPRPGPARFFGLAFSVADLDATAAFLGDKLRPAKDAVQEGRRIATLDRAAGSTVPIAFMSPHL